MLDRKGVLMEICNPCTENRHQSCVDENCDCVATLVAEASRAVERARFAFRCHAARPVLIICQGGLVREVLCADKRYEICDLDEFEDASEREQVEYYDGLSTEMQDYLQASTWKSELPAARQF